MTRALTTLVDFNIANGAYPYAGLIADANGDLFGTKCGLAPAGEDFPARAWVRRPSSPPGPALADALAQGRRPTSVASVERIDGGWFTNRNLRLSALVVKSAEIGQLVLPGFAGTGIAIRLVGAYAGKGRPMRSKIGMRCRWLASGVAMALSVACGTIASAGSVEEGKAAWNEGHFANAMEILRPLAVAGDPAAQFLVGLMYESGQGVPEDLAEGVRWFEAAAEKGSADALYSLCQDLSLGGGNIQRDSLRAYVWCDLAAAAYRKAKRLEQARNAEAIRGLISGKLTADQLAEAERQVTHWTAAH